MANLSAFPSSYLCLAVLLLPYLSLLLLFIPSIVRAALCMIWNRLDDGHLPWHLAESGFHSDDSRGTSGAELAAAASPGFDGVRWVLGGAALSTRLHKRRAPAPEGAEDAVRCVFCLCDVEDGEEVRELSCEHLFHRSCLDRWVAVGRFTCPLCRKPLAAKAAEVELPCEAAVGDAAGGEDQQILAIDGVVAW